MASADDLQRALEGLTNAIERVDKAQAARSAQAKIDRDQTRAERESKQAESLASRAEKESRAENDKNAKADSDDLKRRSSNPVGKLLSAYRSAGMAGQGATSGAMSGNVTGAVQGLLSAGNQVGGAADAVSGTLGGGVAGGLGAAGVGIAAAVAVDVFALYEFKQAMDAATHTTIAHYRELGKASGVMAGVLAQRDVRELMRDQEKGNRLAEVAGALTDAEQNRADASKEIDIAWEEFKAGFLVSYNQLLGDILEQISLLVVEFRGGNETVNVESLGGMLDKAAEKTDKDLGRHRANLPPLGRVDF